MYDTILVPLDGSPTAEQVLPLAALVARRAGMTLELAKHHRAHPMAHARDTMLAAIDVEGRRRAIAGNYLRRIAAMVGEGGRLRVVTRLLDDPSPTADAICGESERVKAAMIAMTTHGRTGMLRAIRGSVADGVLREARVPVLLWRASETGSRPAAIAPTHMLVALDGSVWAEMALPIAAVLASRFEARLTLLQVVPDVVAVVPEMVPAPAEVSFGDAAHVLPLVDPQATQLAIARAAEYVRRTAARVRLEHPELAVGGRVENDEHPARTIVRVAREIGAEIVAMTTHGRGTSRLVVGSTVDGVLGTRDGAMLIVHPSIPHPRFST